VAVAIAVPSYADAPQGEPGAGLELAQNVATGTVVGADQVPLQRAGPSGFFPVDTDCLSFDEYGYQTWSGGFAPGVSELGDELSAIVDANNSFAAGVAICSNRAGLAVFVAERDPELIAQIDAAAAKHPSLPVSIEDVAVGAGTAEAVALRLRDADFGSTITAVGVDVHTGGLLVSVLPEAMSREADPVTAESIHSYVLAVEGLELPVALEPVPAGEDSSGLADSAA
jgi:hypothetical protein